MPKLLTCYVLFPERQEAGEPLVSVWKCQNWPEKVSRTTVESETPHVNAQLPRNEF